MQDTSRYSLAFYPRPNPNRSLSEDVDDITFADLFLQAGGFSDRVTPNRTMSERCMSLSLPSIKIDQNTNTSRGIDYEVPKAYSYSQDLSMTFWLTKRTTSTDFLIAGPDSSTTTILEDLDTRINTHSGLMLTF